MKILHICVLLITLMKINSELSVNYNNSNQIIHKITNIFDEYYEDKYTHSSIVVITEDNLNDNISDEILRHVHRSGKCKVISIKFNSECILHSTFQINSIPKVGHINMMLIFLSELNNLNETFDCFKNTTTGRLPTKIIIIIQFSINSENIQNIFKSLWERRILNAVVVTNLSDNIDIIGFNPYFDDYFENLTSKNIFYDKLKDLNGYKLRLFLARSDDFNKVRIYQVGDETRYMGHDGMAVQTVIKYMNGSFDVIDISKIFGTDNPWRPVNKGIKDHLKQPIITKYKPDLFFDQIEMEYNVYTELIFPPTQFDGTVIVPKAGFKNIYQVLQRVFEKGFLFIAIFFVIICPIVWFILIIMEEVIKKYTRTMNLLPRLWMFFPVIVFNNIRAFLGFSFNIPRVNFIHNYFLIWILLCNLVVNNYFQSILTSILTVSERESDIDSIQQLAESDIRPFAAMPIANEFISNLNSTGSKYIPKFTPMPPRLYEINYKKLPRNFSVLAEMDKLTSMTTICPAFHIIREVFRPYVVCYNVFKGSPYHDVIEKLVFKMREAGLYEFWKNQNDHYLLLIVGLCDIYVEQDDRSGGFKILRIENLTIAFYALFLGWVVAFFVFVTENLFYIIKKNVK